MPRRWRPPHPDSPVVVRPSLTCTFGPRYPTRWLALAPLAAVAAGHQTAAKCPDCRGWHHTDTRKGTP